MARNEKELLLKDICARLPYGVKVGTTDNDGSLENVWEVLWYNTFTEDIKLINSIELDAEKIADISEIRPYLFPMSSMTEEQEKEWNNLSFDPLDVVLEGKFNGKEERLQLINKSLIDPVQWCYKNHFDIYGLIPMDLAIDATNLNIY